MKNATYTSKFIVQITKYRIFKKFKLFKVAGSFPSSERT